MNGLGLALLLAGTLATFEPPEAPSRRALIVGVAEYSRMSSLPSLSGPREDVRLIRSLLVDVLGFNERDILELSTNRSQPEGRPTKANILAGLAQLSSSVRPGDEIVIYLSGHGTRQRDDSGDEADGWDEVFLPEDVYPSGPDGPGTIPNALVDDELGQALDRLRSGGAFVWLIVDACHSGTLDRDGADTRSRHVSPERFGLAPPDPVHHRGGARDSEAMLEGERGNLVACFATLSHLAAKELPLPPGQSDATVAGVFTWALVHQLRASGGRMTFRDLESQMRRAYEGLLADRRLYGLPLPVFTGATERPLIGSGAKRRLRLRISRKRAWILEAGQLHGISQGTRLSVHRLGESADALGWVEVEDAGWLTARCRPIVAEVTEDRASFPSSLGAGTFAAEVVERAAAPRPLRVSILDPDGQDCQSLPSEVSKCLVDGSGWILRVAPGSEEAAIVVTPSGNLRVAFERDGPQWPLEDLGRSLPCSLLQAQRAKNLGDLPSNSDGARFPGGIRAELRVQGEPLSGESVEPGAVLSFRLLHEGGRPWDVWCFLLDEMSQLTLLHPLDGDSPTRLPGDRTEAIEFLANDETLREASLLTIVLPAQTPTRLDWLERDPCRSDRGGPGDPMRDLLRLRANRSGGEEVTVRMHRQPLQFSWRSQLPPSDSLGAHWWEVEMKPRPTPTRGRPDPRRPGHRFGSVRLLGEDSAVDDMMVTEGVGFRSFWIDLDESPPFDPESGGRLEDLFEPEIILQVFDDHRVAAYDRDLDGELDWILVDDDSDAWADTCWRLGSKGWEREENVRLHWLRLAWLPLPTDGFEQMRWYRKLSALTASRGK